MKKNHLLALATVVTLPLLLGSLSGCSSESASSNGASSKGASPGAKTGQVTAADWELAKAKCMRAAGVDYQDPDPSGKRVQEVTGDPAAFLKAETACGTEVTAKLGEQPVSEAEKKQNDEWKANNDKINDCLRKKGYDVPDGGGLSAVGDIPDSAYAACGDTSVAQ